MLRSYFSINCRHDRESQRATERVYELFVKYPNKALNYEIKKIHKLIIIIKKLTIFKSFFIKESIINKVKN